MTTSASTAVVELAAVARLDRIGAVEIGRRGGSAAPSIRRSSGPIRGGSRCSITWIPPSARSSRMISPALKSVTILGRIESGTGSLDNA